MKQDVQTKSQEAAIQERQISMRDNVLLYSEPGFRSGKQNTEDEKITIRFNLDNDRELQMYDSRINKIGDLFT